MVRDHTTRMQNVKSIDGVDERVKRPPMCKESSANFLLAKSELHSFSIEEIQTAMACPLVNI
jgi:hypothetical protein